MDSLSKLFKRLTMPTARILRFSPGFCYLVFNWVDIRTFVTVNSILRLDSSIFHKLCCAVAFLAKSPTLKHNSYCNCCSCCFLKIREGLWLETTYLFQDSVSLFISLCIFINVFCKSYIIWGDIFCRKNNFF